MVGEIQVEGCDQPHICDLEYHEYLSQFDWVAREDGNAITHIRGVVADALSQIRVDGVEGTLGEVTMAAMVIGVGRGLVCQPAKEAL